MKYKTKYTKVFVYDGFGIWTYVSPPLSLYVFMFYKFCVMSMYIVYYEFTLSSVTVEERLLASSFILAPTLGLET